MLGLGFLLLFGWVPLLIFIVASIIIIVGIDQTFDDESHVTWATLALVVGIVLIEVKTKFNPVPWLQSHVGAIILGILLYFVAGTIWGFWKWYLYCLDSRDKQAERNVTEFELPVAKKHKGRITGWMTFWPWSFIWWILHEPITRAWRFIYARVAVLFQRVSDHVFRNVKVKTKKDAWE